MPLPQPNPQPNPLQRTIKKYSIAFLLVSLLGMLDAGYLTVKHYTGAYIPCNILDGCNAVAQSEYSAILGIPVALLGVVFYVTVFILSMALLDSKNEKLIKYILLFAISGFVVSLFLTYLQVFVIKALCIYCLVSAVNTVVLLALSIMLSKHAKISQIKTQNI
jgi:uncharacterized membrane protein